MGIKEGALALFLSVMIKDWEGGPFGRKIYHDVFLYFFVLTGEQLFSLEMLNVLDYLLLNYICYTDTS